MRVIVAEETTYAQARIAKSRSALEPAGFSEDKG
jgi:hypothetical protein